MGRLRMLLNLVILAIGAWIAWHEYHHPPATRPEPAPEPAPAPSPRAETPIPPKAPPPVAPAPPPTREETTAQPSAPEAPPASAATSAAATAAGTSAVTTGDAGEAARVADSTAARISAMTEAPVVPENAVRGDGTRDCPEAYPIKGNATSRIYHEPGRPSYDRTIAEFCFATVEAAEAAGFRAPRH